MYSDYNSIFNKHVLYSWMIFYCASKNFDALSFLQSPCKCAMVQWMAKCSWPHKSYCFCHLKLPTLTYNKWWQIRSWREMSRGEGFCSFWPDSNWPFLKYTLLFHCLAAIRVVLGLEWCNGSRRYSLKHARIISCPKTDSLWPSQDRVVDLRCPPFGFEKYLVFVNTLQIAFELN